MPTQTNKSKRPVIADPDVPFLQKIFYECRKPNFSPLVISCPDQLQRLVESDSSSVSGIFLNPAMIRAPGSRLMGSIREHLPNTPVFYIIDETAKSLDAKDLRRLTVTECLKKPFSPAELERALLQSPLPFDSESALELAESDPLNVEMEEPDEAFTPILARNFVAGRETYFDLYVKLNPRKYVKILKAGDPFSQERIDAYLRKEIGYFYIRRKVQENYLQYCDKISQAVLDSGNTRLDVKAGYVFNVGEETTQFMRHNGVQESTIRYARQFAKKSLELALQITSSNNELIHRYLEENLHIDHSVSVTMVASLLATHLNFDHDRAARIVGLSGMLHDIGMLHIAKELHGTDPSQLNSEDLAIYEAHPLIGQELLRNVPGIEPIVLQAVGQHHERRNGRGFPHRLKSGSINIVAEIIGISEEFIEQLSRWKTDRAVNPFLEMERRYNGFSPSTVSSFRLFFGR